MFNKEEVGEPGWLSRLSVQLRLRSWSRSLWVQALHQAQSLEPASDSVSPLSLPLPHSASLSLSLSLSFSKIKIKKQQKINKIKIKKQGKGKCTRNRETSNKGDILIPCSSLHGQWPAKTTLVLHCQFLYAKTKGYVSCLQPHQWRFRTVSSINSTHRWHYTGEKKM